MSMSYVNTVTKAGINIAYFHNVLRDRFADGASIINIESSENALINTLDTKCGIDAMLVCNDGQLRGLAVRVQEIQNPYNTFTIRFKIKSGNSTEFDKRIEAINKNKIYPQYTIQAYVHNGVILSIGIIDTKSLFTQITHNPNILHENRNGDDGTIFKYVKWSMLKDVNNWSHKTNSLFEEKV